MAKKNLGWAGDVVDVIDDSVYVYNDNVYGVPVPKQTTSNSTVNANTAIYNDLLKQINNSINAQAAMLNNANAQAQAQLQAQKANQKASVNRSYDDAQRQAYVQMMQTKANMPKTLQNLGYTGGLSESAMIGANTAYGNALNNIALNRADAIRSIEEAIGAKELDLAMKAAQQNANLESSRIDALQSAYANLLKNTPAYEEVITYVTPTYTLTQEDIGGILGEMGLGVGNRSNVKSVVDKISKSPAYQYGVGMEDMRAIIKTYYDNDSLKDADELDYVENYFGVGR